MDAELADATLDSIAQISPVAIIGLDAQHLINLWSTAATGMFGWTAEEVIGKSLPFAPQLEPPLPSGPVRTRVKSRSGELIEVEVRSGHRRPHGWIMTMADLIASA